jgi:hypothetical protein
MWVRTAGIVIFALSVLGSCDQFPIFFQVSKEVKPKKERIPGSPSKIVQAGEAGSEKLFVSNGRIWQASGPDWKWSEIDHHPSGGRILDIAAVGSGQNWALVALSGDGSSSTIWTMVVGSTVNWQKMKEGKYQAIYGANGELIAAVRRDGEPQSDSRNFDVVLVGGPADIPLWEKTHFPSGVVYSETADKLYIATAGSGIQFWDTSGSLSPPPPATPVSMEDTTVVGIIEYADGKIAALTNSSKTAGRIYQINAADGAVNSKSEEFSRSFTGALGVWEQTARGKLLLAGVRVTNVRFGYHEMTINGENLSFSAGLNEPRKNAPTSISSDDYTATIEPRAVNSIIQAPSQESKEWPLMFASTQAYGLWSYRYDDSEHRYVWNAED